VQDDPETHSYNVQEMVDAFVQKAKEWQDCVQGGLQRSVAKNQVQHGRHTQLVDMHVNHNLCQWQARSLRCSRMGCWVLLICQPFDPLLLLLQVMTCSSSWGPTSPTVTRAHGSATWIR
jgi:hypothetical protein